MLLIAINRYRMWFQVPWPQISCTDTWEHVTVFGDCYSDVGTHHWNSHLHSFSNDTIDSQRQNDCLTQLVSGRDLVWWCFITCHFPSSWAQLLRMEHWITDLVLVGSSMLWASRCYDTNHSSDQLYLSSASYFLIEPGFWLNTLLKIHCFLLPLMVLIYCQSDSLEVLYFLFHGHRGGQHRIFPL